MHKAWGAYGAFLLFVAPWLNLIIDTYLGGEEGGWLFLIGAPTIILMTSGLWHMGRLYRQARAAGLDKSDARRLFSPPPPRATFWQQPEVQKLLLPPEGVPPTIEEAVPRTPNGYLRALSQAAKASDGPRKLLTEEAASAAREILRAIEEVDSQTEDLASSSDPAEVARYKQRLEALGTPGDAEPESKRKMRDMLTQQLDLAQSLADQLEEARERRARLLNMLKTLWLQIANLKAQVTTEGFDSSEMSQKVRAIAEDVQRYREASEQAVKLLEGQE